MQVQRCCILQPLCFQIDYETTAENSLVLTENIADNVQSQH